MGESEDEVHFVKTIKKKYVPGTTFWRFFGGDGGGWFEGRIDWERDGLYHVRYDEDGDEEDLAEDEITELLRNHGPKKRKVSSSPLAKVKNSYDDKKNVFFDDHFIYSYKVHESDSDDEISSCCSSENDEEYDPSLNRISWDQFLGFRREDILPEETILQPLGEAFPPSEDDTINGSSEQQSPSKKRKRDERGRPIRNKRTWSQRYEELKAYVAVRGDCFVSFKENPKLNKWASMQRWLYKRNQLSKDQEQKLEQIGFHWKSRTKPKHSGTFVEDQLLAASAEDSSIQERVDEFESGEEEAITSPAAMKIDQATWNQRYEELKAYVALHGNCLPRHTEYPKLSRWVGHQRYYYHRKRLPKDCELKLQKIGFVWKHGKRKGGASKDARNAKGCHGGAKRDDSLWNQRYHELQVYLAVHGDCLVPKDYKENASLGRWVSWQRHLYRSKKLLGHRELKLKQIGFVWKASTGRRNHRATSVEEDGSEASESASSQESSEEEEEMENQGGSNWSEEAWNQRYDELKAYAAVHGDCLVPYHFQENIALGGWVSRQRHMYKTNKLLKHRYLKLQQIGFVWSAPSGKRNHTATSVEEDGSEASESASSQESSEEEEEMENQEGSNRGDTAWKQRYDELKAYLAVHGDCLVPFYYKENTSLGRWVCWQRHLYWRNQLLKHRELKLKQIGFAWSARTSSTAEASEAESSQESAEEVESEEEIENQGEVNRSEAAWNKRYGELKAYLAVHGDCLVPFQYKENTALGGWVSKQRHWYRTNKLLKHRELKLKRIGFVWSPRTSPKATVTPVEGSQSEASEEASSQESSEEEETENQGGSNRSDAFWNQQYGELEAYLAVHGDCLVPYHYKENAPLGHWVSNQRHLYKTNKLRKHRYLKLRQIGFVWSSPRGGRRKPSATSVEDNPSEASESASAQESSEELESEEEEMENRGGSNRGETIWNHRFGELKAYVAVHGDCLVPRHYKENVTLGGWVNTQRWLYKTNKLLKHRELKLRKLGFVWNARTCPKARASPVKEEDLSEASEAASSQESSEEFDSEEEYKQEASSQESSEEFESEEEEEATNPAPAKPVPAVKTQQKDDWNQMYEQLKVYVAANGNCLVPRNYKYNHKLGIWVSTQRSLYSHNLLSRDHELKLQQLGFVWKVENGRCLSRDDTTWNQRYEELKAYVAVHGDCLVSRKEYPQLGQWVANQRWQYNAHQLPNDRKLKLSELGFVWKTIASAKKISTPAEGGPMQKCTKDFGREKDEARSSAASSDKAGIQQKPRNNRHEVAGGEEGRATTPNLTGQIQHKTCNQKCNQLQESQMRSQENPSNLVDLTIEGSSDENEDEDERKPSADFVREVARIKIVNFREERWNQMYNELKAYAAKHGDCKVPNPCKEKPELGRWVLEHRIQYREGRLPKAREQKLRQIGFVWSAESPSGQRYGNEEQWEQKYKELQQYATESGNCCPPQKGEHQRLAEWVVIQRKNYRRGTIREVRKRKLDELGFVWEVKGRTNSSEGQNNMESEGTSGIPEGAASGVVKEQFEELWDQRYNELKSYKAANGNCDVPRWYSANPYLGNWVQRQRTLFTKKEIRKDRKLKLDDLGFSWDMKGG